MKWNMIRYKYCVLHWCSLWFRFSHGLLCGISMPWKCSRCLGLYTRRACHASRREYTCTVYALVFYFSCVPNMCDLIQWCVNSCKIFFHVVCFNILFLSVKWYRHVPVSCYYFMCIYRKQATKVMIQLLGTYTEDNASQARDDAHRYGFNLGWTILQLYVRNQRISLSLYSPIITVMYVRIMMWSFIHCQGMCSSPSRCIVTCLEDPNTFLMDHLLTLKPVKFLEGELIHDVRKLMFFYFVVVVFFFCTTITVTMYFCVRASMSICFHVTAFNNICFGKDVAIFSFLWAKQRLCEFAR